MLPDHMIGEALCVLIGLRFVGKLLMRCCPDINGKEIGDGSTKGQIGNILIDINGGHLLKA